MGTKVMFFTAAGGDKKRSAIDILGNNISSWCSNNNYEVLNVKYSEIMNTDTYDHSIYASAAVIYRDYYESSNDSNSNENVDGNNNMNNGMNGYNNMNNGANGNNQTNNAEQPNDKNNKNKNRSKN